MRYATEGFFRCITRDLPTPPFYPANWREYLLDELGYTFGDKVIHAAEAGIFFFFILLGWFVIHMKNRNY